MDRYSDLLKMVFSNPKGDELLQTLAEQEIFRPLPSDVSEAELRWQEGRRSLVIEFLNVLKVEERK